MKRFFPILVVFMCLAGCAEAPESEDKQGGSPSKAPAAGVVIERVGEQIVGVKASHGDVKVVDDVPRTEQEYRERHGNTPKKFLFSESEMRFFTYRRGVRVALPTTHER